MKLNNSIQQPTFSIGDYVDKQIYKKALIAPNPPTEEMVKKAQFIDKTYIWKHAGVRSGDERSSK